MISFIYWLFLLRFHVIVNILVTLVVDAAPASFHALFTFALGRQLVLVPPDPLSSHGFHLMDLVERISKLLFSSYHFYFKFGHLRTEHLKRLNLML